MENSPSLANRPIGQRKQQRPAKAPSRRSLASQGSQLAHQDELSTKQQQQQKRAAARPRKSLPDDMDIDSASEPDSSGDEAEGLNATDLAALYQNTMKLASENKIGPKNTWSLPLIDHLSDLIKPSQEEGNQTNFQRASCTLDAGVKIYSYRVDNIHSETYKVLSGMGRTGGQAAEADEGDGAMAGDGNGANDDDNEDGGKRQRRRALHTDVNPSSTLEPSFAALNVKKFDLAFAVDPLFKKTSAQFDEGGAKGLLLNNLSVFCGCEVVFDSNDVPERAIDSATESLDVQVDLSSLQAQLDIAMQTCAGGDISPSINELYSLLGAPVDPNAGADAARLVAEVAGSAPSTSYSRAAASSDAQPMETGDSALSAPGTRAPDADAGGDPVDDGADDYGGADDGGFSDGGYPDDGPGDDMDAGEAAHGTGWLNDDDTAEHQASGQPFSAEQPASTAVSQLTSLQASLDSDAVQWLLSAGSGAEASASLTSGAGWAGASHWKFRAAAAAKAGDQEGESAQSKPARRERKVFSIDFLNLPELPAGAFEQAAKKDICLKTSVVVNTLLPEDVHYHASSLAQLFLKPNAVISAARGGGNAHESSGDFGADGDYGEGDFGPAGRDDDHDDDDNKGGGWADMDFSSGAGEGLELVSAPRKVEKISINYSRASKVVDVRMLKETLRQGLQAVQAPQDPQQQVSFQDILSRIPADTRAGRPEDISVHLCIICLLHLANEHGLAITGTPSLDALTITSLPNAWA
ncbi:hypothetical protein WJX72_001485 [[Myrmecia] bisecta]|uniref:Condensin complex subunit 2 n=1 Tax=[Myrmecia] bisecta TaxID=41462 RepID=A0AAW1QE81_9CHLO